MSVNAISPLGAKSPAGPVPAAESQASAAQASERSAQTSAPPSTQLTLQAVSRNGVVYTPPVPMPTVEPVWETQSNDAISRSMASNLESGAANRFGSLGSALLDRLAFDGSDYSQSAFQYQMGRTPSANFNSVMQTQLHQFADNRITLQVTTQSGAQVEISLGSQDSGLAVQAKVTGGTLTAAERDALGALSDSFQKAIDGMTEVPPRLDLGGLTQFDSSVLSSVDLKAQFKLASGDMQTFAFHADTQQRSLSVAGPSGTVQVSVDMRNEQILGSSQQQAQALNNYLQQFGSAQLRGRGGERGPTGLMDMFRDAFTELHSNYPATSAGMQARLGGIELNKTDHSMLTGLADFSASVSEAKQYSNPMRPQEVDAFSYSVSQATSMQGSGRMDRSVTQLQQSHLTASYHSGLIPGTVPLLDTNKLTQNYYYTQIDDTASSRVDIAYDKGKLVKATLTQSASQSTHVQKYDRGNLVSDTTTPLQQVRSRNLMDLLDATIGDDDDNRLESELSRIRSTVLLRAEPRQLS